MIEYNELVKIRISFFTNNTNIDGFKKFLTLEDRNSSLGIGETMWWITYKNPLFKGIVINYNSGKLKNNC